MNQNPIGVVAIGETAVPTALGCSDKASTSSSAPEFVLDVAQKQYAAIKVGLDG